MRFWSSGGKAADRHSRCEAHASGKCFFRWRSARLPARGQPCLLTIADERACDGHGSAAYRKAQRRPASASKLTLPPGAMHWGWMRRARLQSRMPRRGTVTRQPRRGILSERRSGSLLRPPHVRIKNFIRQWKHDEVPGPVENLFSRPYRYRRQRIARHECLATATEPKISFGPVSHSIIFSSSRQDLGLRHSPQTASEGAASMFCSC